MSRATVIRIVLGVISGAGMALAALLLLGPDVGPPPMIPFQDKVFHVLAFMALTGPAVLALPRSYMWFWLAHMVALGGGIEIAQAMGDEGRTGSWADFFADCVGIGAGAVIGLWIRARLGSWLVTER